MPTRRNDKTILKCPRCGYEIEIKGDVKRDYRIEAKSGIASKIKTTSVVSEGTGSHRSREEIEQEKEEFYEVFLELMGSEEGEGGET